MQAQILGPGIVYLPASPPRETLVGVFQPDLDKWGAGKRYGPDPSKVAGYEKVRAAIVACDAALAKLGKRTGPRVDAARKYLAEHADACRKALEAFITIGEGCDGPVALELIERITTYRAGESAAKAAFNLAGREKVKAARDALDAIAADGRELDREIVTLRGLVKFPALPDLASLDRARSETEEITIGGNAEHKPATTLQRALEQAAAAPKGVALLWCCFEPAGANEACEWRWRRHQESRG